MMEDWEYHCICPDGEDCPVHGKGGVEALLEQARADNAALVEFITKAKESLDLPYESKNDQYYDERYASKTLANAIANHGARGAALLAKLNTLRTALNDAIEMLQWSTGAWGNTSEEDLKKARPVLHAAIARYRAVVSS